MTSGPSRSEPEPFETIDALVCGRGIAPRAVSDRARACQEALGARDPLSRTIASRLLDRPGARVALYTGFVVSEAYPAGENDGPLGAAALARALSRSRMKPTLFVDPEVTQTTRWLLGEIGTDAPVIALDGALHSLARPPDVAIAIEKPGINPAGVLHTFDGARIERGSRPIDHLFVEFARAGTLTVGIGDLGNEIGFGRLREQLLEMDPRMRTCTCGCGCGVAAATETDLLYPSVVSNWGAYGLAAGIALLSGNPACALEAVEERRMLLVAAVRGCRDGVRRRGVYGVDGFGGELSVRVVRKLRRLVAHTLERSEEEDACA